MKAMPCKGCTERSVGCHSKCSRYQETKKTNIEESRWLMRQNLQNIKPTTAKYKKGGNGWRFPEQGINRRNRIKEKIV